MEKNKQKTTLLFLFMILVIVTAIAGCSCSLLTKNKLPEEEEIQNLDTNNYQGLRVETRNLNLKDLDDCYPRIVCFGDSVTFGWNKDYEDSYPDLVEELLAEDYPGVRVINSGIAGDTIVDAYNRIESDVLIFEPHVVIINSGLNDGRIQKKNGEEDRAGSSRNGKGIDENQVTNVDLETFEMYYSLILERLKSADIKVILMGINYVKILPSGEEDSVAEEQIEIYKEYNELVREISVNNDIDFIDLWDIFDTGDEKSSYLQDDGIHPDIEGLRVIAENVYSSISEYDF
ncbi:MAG: GDSL-type esterase/lipase family protein [Actinomycetota bacterium]|nr:GDSL-type esterase/lipase family protein [Actinomycetota bacterium]